MAYTIGRAAIIKIMEVEGHSLTEADLALLDEIENLLPAERRERILAYVKTGSRDAQGI